MKVEEKYLTQKQLQQEIQSLGQIQKKPHVVHSWDEFWYDC